MAKYTVKGTNILYNTKLYAEGETIELNDDEAKSLVDYLELIPEKAGKQIKQTKEAEASAKDSTTADVTDITTDGGTK